VPDNDASSLHVRPERIAREGLNRATYLDLYRRVGKPLRWEQRLLMPEAGRMRRGIQIQPDDIRPLGLEVRIIGCHVANRAAAASIRA
jgi:hypothetical protein